MTDMTVRCGDDDGVDDSCPTVSTVMTVDDGDG